MSDDYSAADYSSEEELEEISSDIEDDDDDDAAGRIAQQHHHQQFHQTTDYNVGAEGQAEILDSDSDDDAGRNLQDDQTKLTDIIKTQQRIIDSLRKELASMQFQSQLPSSPGHNRKCATKSEESTSAVVSSFEDDDEDDLDSLSSEASANVVNGYDSLPDRVAPLLTNPLFVDVIIQKVMENLPLKSLLLARFVCHKWNLIAAHQLASDKCGPVQLEVHQPWKPSKGIKVSTFIDVMRNSFSCPFSRYSISSFNALEELDRFFFHFGRSVKHLDLNFSEEFEDSNELLMLLTRKLPHLESLRVGCCQMFKSCGANNESLSKLEGSLRNLRTFCVGNIINIIPSKLWLEGLFKMMPKLEKLVLHVNFKENGNSFIRIVLESLMMAPKVLKNLQNLMISCLTESHLRTLIKLAEVGLRLKHFRFQDLCLHLTEINGATLETFLTSQAEHLETLEIEQSSNFPRIRHFQLPVMKKLRTFSILSSQRISFGSLTYSVHLPKLEKLVLRGFDVFNCANIFPHSQQQNAEALQRRTPFIGHSLKSLSLPSKLSIPHFPRVLSRLFPNVTELEVRGVTNECLKEIWESWPRLDKFKLVVSHFDDNIDSGMTGIPENTCRELRSEGQLDSGQLEEYKSGSSITDLKQLRSLELECRAMWIPCQLITDVTGYFALVHLTSLQKLKVTEIGVPEKFDLSNECITEIINTLKIDDATFKIMDDHGRWQLELGRIDLLRNTYESEPQLEDHNKDKVYAS